METKTSLDNINKPIAQLYDKPLIYDEELYTHKAKTGISKYDLIKVNILSGSGDSYSTLSRLIIYRMLTCIGVGLVHQVETSHAGAIAKSIKKDIVNDEKMTITNEELENYIYKSLEQHDYSSLIPIYEYMDK